MDYVTCEIRNSPFCLTYVDMNDGQVGKIQYLVSNADNILNYHMKILAYILAPFILIDKICGHN